MKDKFKKWGALVLALMQIISLSSMLSVGTAAAVTASDLVDFVVEVPTGRDIRVLQLTDPQTIDASQQRYVGRLESSLAIQWAPDTEEKNAYQYMREVITAYQPDLILMTGDLVFGSLDDNGTRLKSLIDFMEGFQIPWAPVFGNHENESIMGADWQSEQLEKAEYCLFKQRELTGNGNYTVGITQGGKLVRVFYMMDTNGCADMSAATAANGHSKSTYGFGQDQIDWYTESIKAVKAADADTKISMAFHVQMAAFEDAFKQIDGFDKNTVSSSHVDLDADSNEATFGYMAQWTDQVWDEDKTVWNSFKKLGVDSIFVGHLHSNSGSVVYDGIRVTFGLKSSTYDQTLYATASGKVSSYTTPADSTPVVGATAIDIAADGTADVYHIYYSDLERNDSIPEGADCIKLDSVETTKVGNNLSGLFTAMTQTSEAPIGFGGQSVYTATSGHIGGTDGGVCTTVDLSDYDLTGKTVYLRYYIPSYTVNGTPEWKLTVNDGSALTGANKNTGTDNMPFSTNDVQYNAWTNLDITEGIRALHAQGCTDFGITYWAGLSSPNTCTVYVDGLYVVTPEADPVVADGTAIKLKTVETTKVGNNLSGLFTAMTQTSEAPIGFGGQSVYTATSGHIGGTDGGVCTTVDLSDYDLTGKSVYLRYYIPSYTVSGTPAWKLTVNDGSSLTGSNKNSGTDNMPFSTDDVQYNAWTNLDITEGIRALHAQGCTDFGITYWAGLSSPNTCTVYVDGLYLVDREAPQDDPIPEDAELVKLDDLEVDKEGTNLNSLFVGMSETTNAPAGFGGTPVYAATSGWIDGTSGGTCVAVDLESLGLTGNTLYNMEGRKVYLRYYIPSYVSNGIPTIKLAENEGQKRGTGYMPFSSDELKYDCWALLDITDGVWYSLADRHTNFAITFWPVLSGSNTATMYVDGLYVTPPTAETPRIEVESVTVNNEDEMTVTFTDKVISTADTETAIRIADSDGNTVVSVPLEMEQKEDGKSFTASIDHEGKEIRIDNVSLLNESGKELLVGGDMNVKTDATAHFFSAYESTKLTWYEKAGVDGSGYIGLNVPTSGNACVKYRTDGSTAGVAMEKGKTYTLSYDVYVPENAVDFVALDFETMQTHAYPEIFRQVKETGKWIHISSTFTFQDETGTHSLRLFGQANGGSVAADSIRSFSALWEKLESLGQGYRMELTLTQGSRTVRDGFVGGFVGQNAGRLVSTVKDTALSESYQYAVTKDDYGFDPSALEVLSVKQTGAHTLIVEFSDDVELVDAETFPFVALRMIDPFTDGVVSFESGPMQWQAQSIGYYGDRKDALLVTFADHIDIGVLASKINMAEQFIPYDVVLCIEEGDPNTEDFVSGNGLLHQIRRLDDAKQLDSAREPVAGNYNYDSVLRPIELIDMTADLSIDKVEVIDQTRIVMTFSEAVKIRDPDANIRLVNDDMQTKQDENGRYQWSGRIEYYNDDHTQLVFILHDSLLNHTTMPVTGLDDLFGCGYEKDGWKLMLALSDNGSFLNGVVDSVVSTTGKILLADIMTTEKDAVYQSIDSSQIAQGSLSMTKVSVISDIEAVITFSAPVEIVESPWTAIRLYSADGYLLYHDFGSGEEPVQWGCYGWEYYDQAHTQIKVTISAGPNGLSNYTDILSTDWEAIAPGSRLVLGFEENNAAVVEDNGRVDNVRLAADARIRLTATTLLSTRDGAYCEMNMEYAPKAITSKAEIINDMQIRVTFSRKVDIIGSPFMAIRMINEDGGLLWYGDDYNRTPVQFSGNWEWENDSHTSVVWTMNGDNAFGACNITDIVNYIGGLESMKGTEIRMCIEEMTTDAFTVVGMNGRVDNIVAMDQANHLESSLPGGYDGIYMGLNTSVLKDAAPITLLGVKAIDDQTLEITFSEPVRVIEGEKAPTIQLRYVSATGKSEVLVDGKTANFKGVISYDESRPNSLIWTLKSSSADSLSDIFNYNGNFKWNEGARVVLIVENTSAGVPVRTERMWGIASTDGYRNLTTDFSYAPVIMLDVELAYQLPPAENEANMTDNAEIQYYSNYLPYILIGSGIIAVGIVLMIVWCAKSKKEEKR